MRSRSISPSTSIRSYCSEDSDSDDSGDDFSRYAGLTGEELNEIWERRNLAYFDRRQRLLAEERERQQQQGMSGDSSAASNNSGSSSHSSVAVQEQRVQQQQQQQQRIAPPAGFICAADDPQWRDMTSRNIMGDYDPARASREPAYHNAWVSCQRLVNMNRSGAAAGNFIPTNPRLAALLEHRRLEMARERYEEETARRQQQAQWAAAQHRMMVDGSAPQQNPSPSFASSAGVPAVLQQQQAAEYERLNQAHRLQQQESAGAYAHGSSNSVKSSSSGSSSAGEKSGVQPVNQTSYYMALPCPTQQLTKSVFCAECSCTLYTTPLAKRFFCQTCGCVSSARQGAENNSFDFEEKMQDAEDHDCQMSY
jgi:hypothetical protein